MAFIAWSGLIIVVLGVFLTDVKYGWVTGPWAVLFGLTVFPHTALICHYAYHSETPAGIPICIATVFLAGWFLFQAAFLVTACPIKISLRLRLMAAGRRILLTSLFSSLVQIPFCIGLFLHYEELGFPYSIAVADTVITGVILFVFLLSGIARIFLTSRRLGIWIRVFFVMFIWVPVVNFFLALWICKKVRQEFVHEVLKAELQDTRESSQICRTRYPLLFLHGIGFRDYKYLNYWGRIPALLIRNGADIFYGHQQAWGTVEDNANEVKQTLEKILEKTGCEKVNIIAHSKGGLDARYLISSLKMGKYIASLTTISTPHHGSELIDVLEKLPDGLYRTISNFVNWYFSKLGDAAPNCYVASKQLSPKFLREFNEKNADVEGVYYQSYAAEMKAPTSNSLLMIPFSIMKWVSGNNDGLVKVDSAKWGTFKGVFQSRTHRGISHGDLIDLFHQDYEGFNMSEEYVTIVSNLRESGF